MAEMDAARRAADRKMDSKNAVLCEREREADKLLPKVREIINECLRQVIQNLVSTMTQNNLTAAKMRLRRFCEFTEKRGITVDAVGLKELEYELEDRFRKIVKAYEEREHQRRIKEHIREEEKVLREIEQETKRIERERRIVEDALRKAAERAHGEHTAEVEMLEQKIRELEERSQRAISMAQQTKSGYVYVISNRGSFGNDVYKIGMTRRLEPLDRVKELGDASVPFPFDVHMMISCDDAPALENGLHREFDKQRLNKVNRRKEFFRIDLNKINEAVNKLHGEVEYQADAEALEFMQTLEMDEETERFLAEVDREYQNE